MCMALYRKKGAGTGKWLEGATGFKFGGEQK